MTEKNEQKNQIYIISLDASGLERVAKDEDNEAYTLKIPKIKTLADFAKVYKGTMGNTLDVQHLKTLCNEVEKTIKLNNRRKAEIKKVYSDIFVNLTFNTPIREMDEEDTFYLNVTKHGANLTHKNFKYGNVDTNQKNLRIDLYTKGFNVIQLDDNGNEISNIHYVHYKRSSSKSRNGACLFIQEQYYADMIKWSHLGLSIPDVETTKIDLASLKAYESLVCSEIESTIEIDPKSILIVNDLESPKFDAYQSVTYQDDDSKKIKCENRWRSFSNNCSDGESLLDVSIFKNYNLEKYGFLLLRQGFFKSAALNTNIVDFYKDYFGEAYETATVNDVFGREKKVSDIRMIICPSSLKILKYSTLFFPNENEVTSEQACFDHWCNQIHSDNSVFGIVKHEKSSPFGDNINRLSYQMVNTLPLDLSAKPEDDMLLKLLTTDFQYVQQLKDDDEFFKQHIRIKNNNDDDEESEDSASEKKDSDKDILDSRSFILAMLNRHPDFVKTDLYIDFKHDIIENYRKNMRKGKIKTQSDYCVQFGNVWELLLSTVQKITSNDVLHKGRQCYCPAYYDKKELAIFRSPHVCTGNIMFATNIHHNRLKRYFNLTKNTVVVNAWDNDWPDRSQGSDFDSDALLLVSNQYLTNIAKQCDVITRRGEENKCLYPTPVNKINGENTPRLYTLRNMAEIDYIIAQNKIGKVINTSQLLNSYYWNIKSKGSSNDEYLLNNLYNNISICSSLSQVEIDKAKKMFRNLDIDNILSDCETIHDDSGNLIFSVDTKDIKIEKSNFSKNEIQIFKIELEKLEADEACDRERIELFINSLDTVMSGAKDKVYLDFQILKLLPDEIKYKKFNRGEEESECVSKKVKPLFFRYCSKDKNCTFIPFVCPMDHLQVLLSNEFPIKSNKHRLGRTEKISILDLLVKDKQRVNYEQLPKIYKLIKGYKHSANKIYADANKDDCDEKKQERKNQVVAKRLEKITELRNMTIRKSTILYLYNILFDPAFADKNMQKQYQKMRLSMLSMLYEAQPELMKSIFSANKNTQEACQNPL